MANLTNSGHLIEELESKAYSADVLEKNNTTAFTPTGDYQPATKKYVDDNAGTEYNAGPGIFIGNINGRQGPCPDGFHIPLMEEWEGLKTIMAGLSVTKGTDWATKLHMPMCGYRDYSYTNVYDSGSYAFYWSASAYTSANTKRCLTFLAGGIYSGNQRGADGCPIRGFKNKYITPTSDWTVIEGTLGNAGIFWNQTDGLISITDGTTGYTIADKNLGATTVWNSGDTMSEANCGKYYQWGNNYGFPGIGGTVTNTDSTQVDASDYGPGNYYNSDTFIIHSSNWDSSQNYDLWGGITGTIIVDNGIINTGVISVNGQTGDVTIHESNTKTFYLSNTSDLTTGQEIYDYITNNGNPIVSYNNSTYAITEISSTYVRFSCVDIIASTRTSDSYAAQRGLSFTISNGTVTSIQAVVGWTGGYFLRTDVDYVTPYTPLYNGSPATKKYVDDNIEAYNAGEGISISDINKNGRQGPCPEGWHVPETTEWQGVKSIMDELSLTTGDSWRIKLHLPFAGYRSYSSASLDLQGDVGNYWSSSPYGSDYPYYARYLYLNSYIVDANNSSYRANGYSVRCFKDSYVAPDEGGSWTAIDARYDEFGHWARGIFWNQSEGIISITGNMTSGYTIMDKNLGATTVYSDGDTLTQANMGNMYQWGNNYGFPSTGTISNTSSTQVDASSYGPTNPYSSDTYIIGSDDWSSVQNDDLWGNTTGSYTIENAITNTGVTSINDQSGPLSIKTINGTSLVGNGNVSISEFNPTNSGVRKFLKPMQDNDISDLVDWLYDGGGALLYDTYSEMMVVMGNKFYVVIDHNYMDGIITAVRHEGNSVYYLVANYNTSTKIVTSASNTVYTLANASDVLTKTNSTSFTPTGDYQPATKKYVDDHASGGGDMSYVDFSWQTKTGTTITLDLASTYSPSANFTVNAPSTIRDGQTYILRVASGSTAYTMTLGTGITNPYSTDTTLTAYGIDQFVFLAVGGSLELQPEGGAGGAITCDTTGTTSSVSKIWVGTEAEYQALSTYEEDVAYMTF